METRLPRRPTTDGASDPEDNAEDENVQSDSPSTDSSPKKKAGNKLDSSKTGRSAKSAIKKAPQTPFREPLLKTPTKGLTSETPAVAAKSSTARSNLRKPVLDVPAVGDAEEGKSNKGKEGQQKRVKVPKASIDVRSATAPEELERQADTSVSSDRNLSIEP